MRQTTDNINLQVILFERLGLSDVKSRILAACNGTEYFLASLVAIALIDRVGRRKLMLFSATGQCITMVLLAVLGSISNSPANIVSAVLLFVFNSFFAIGWLGMTWLYVCFTCEHRDDLTDKPNVTSLRKLWGYV